MKRWARWLRAPGLLALAVWLAHELLLRAMAGGDVVGKLLSPGSHTPLGTLGLALGFLLLRIAAIVLVPAALAAWLVLRVASPRP